MTLKAGTGASVMGMSSLARAQLRRTDVAPFTIIGWGWRPCPPIRNDVARVILARRLSPTTPPLMALRRWTQALAFSGSEPAPRIAWLGLSPDTGASSVSGDLAHRLDNQAIAPGRSAPPHPQTHARIERWRQTMTNRILMERSGRPGDLDLATEADRRLPRHTRPRTPADPQAGRFVVRPSWPVWLKAGPSNA